MRRIEPPERKRPTLGRRHALGGSVLAGAAAALPHGPADAQGAGQAGRGAPTQPGTDPATQAPAPPRRANAGPPVREPALAS